MRIRIGELRKMIRAALKEGPAGPAIAADPTQVAGFYNYEVERGTDIHSFWYRSPGDKGSGNPGRPDDPEEYIGTRPPADASAESAAPSEGEI